MLDLPGSEEEHDATFDTWDSDASGDLDFAEVQAALRAYAASGGAGGDDDVPLARTPSESKESCTRRRGSGGDVWL